jgi:hypothetical protein
MDMPEKSYRSPVIKSLRLVCLESSLLFEYPIPDLSPVPLKHRLCRTYQILDAMVWYRKLLRSLLRGGGIRLTQGIERAPLRNFVSSLGKPEAMTESEVCRKRHETVRPLHLQLQAEGSADDEADGAFCA